MGLIFYPDTRLLQPCNKVLQCHKVVTTLLPACNLVTRLLQFCIFYIGNTNITTYSCTEINTTNIILFLVPSEPCSLREALVTSTSVTLQWMPPETPNGVITGYSVQYGERVIANFGSKTLMGTVEGLSPDTSYVLQLIAHTRVGRGPPASLSVKTGMLLILQYSKITNYLHCFIAEFKIKKQVLRHMAKYFGNYLAI